MNNKKHTTGRREFISMISAAAAIGLTGIPKVSGLIREYEADGITQPQPEMPMINLGPHRISRLIVGSNPLLGYSYLGSHTDRQMKDYFTTENTVEFLLKCENAGINTHQGSSRMEYLAPLRDRGSKINFISLSSDRMKIKEIVNTSSPIAVVHHGGVTDRLFSEGDSMIVHDYVKAVKDTGLLAGVSAHNPDVIKQIADKGWEVDFFMTCFYYLTRTINMEDPVTTLPTGSYVFYKNDPDTMTRVIRQVKQPCLAFKILGAGRLCSNQEKVKTAFQYAFSNIKPSDGVIVGMFPWFFDEITADAQYVRETGQI